MAAILELAKIVCSGPTFLGKLSGMTSRGSKSYTLPMVLVSGRGTHFGLTNPTIFSHSQLSCRNVVKKLWRFFVPWG